MCADKKMAPTGQGQTSRSLSFHPYFLWIKILPLKVTNCISGPPPLIVPYIARSRCTLYFPLVLRLSSITGGLPPALSLISKSLQISPLLVFIITLALTSPGSVTSTVPLKEVKLMALSGDTLFNDTVTFPLVVLASTDPDTFVLEMPPLVWLASIEPEIFSTVIAHPFTERITRFVCIETWIVMWLELSLPTTEMVLF